MDTNDLDLSRSLVAANARAGNNTYPSICDACNVGPVTAASVSRGTPVAICHVCGSACCKHNYKKTKYGIRVCPACRTRHANLEYAAHELVIASREYVSSFMGGNRDIAMHNLSAAASRLVAAEGD